MGTKFVIYKRLSTKKQFADEKTGSSAQDLDLKIYFDRIGADMTKDVIGTFEEAKSAKSVHQRPRLLEAIDLAVSTGAVLVVSKIDRLSRNATEVKALLNTEGLDVVIATMPDANGLQLSIYAELAEQERKAIAARVKASYEVRRQRAEENGETFEHDTDTARAASDKVIGAVGSQERAERMSQAGKASGVRSKDAADDYAQHTGRYIRQAISNGATSLREVASWMNDNGHTTRQGCQYNAVQVSRLMKRLQITLG